MAQWDYKEGKVRSWPDEPHPDYPGWTVVDCGCCAGIQWGGDSPEECDMCSGSGEIVRHDKSRVLARWPGGPLLGKAARDALEKKRCCLG